MSGKAGSDHSPNLSRFSTVVLGNIQLQSNAESNAFV